MKATDSGSCNANGCSEDGDSQRPGIPEIPGIYGDPMRMHTHVPASVLHGTRPLLTSLVLTPPAVIYNTPDLLAMGRGRGPLKELADSNRTTEQWKRRIRL